MIYMTSLFLTFGFIFIAIATLLKYKKNKECSLWFLVGILTILFSFYIKIETLF